MKTNNSKKKNSPLPAEWKRLLYFFKFYSMESSKAQLWQMLKLSLTSNDETIDENTRASMIFFYETTTELIENIHALLKQKLEHPNTKP